MLVSDYRLPMTGWFMPAARIQDAAVAANIQAGTPIA